MTTEPTSTDDERAERIRRLQEARAKSVAAPRVARAAPGPASADERAERIRLLQARRGGTAAGVTPTGSATADDVDPTPAARSATAPNRRRRRHAAPAGRVLVAGLSASAFLGGVAALGANPPTWTSADGGTSADGTVGAGLAAAAPTTVPPTTMPPVPPTVVVVQEVHHQVYVDESGRPLSGEAMPAASPPRARQASSSGGSAPATATAPAATAAAPPPAAAAPAPAPPPPPPPPACTGSTC